MLHCLELGQTRGAGNAMLCECHWFVGFRFGASSSSTCSGSRSSARAARPPSISRTRHPMPVVAAAETIRASGRWSCPRAARRTPTARTSRRPRRVMSDPDNASSVFRTWMPGRRRNVETGCAVIPASTARSAATRTRIVTLGSPAIPRAAAAPAAPATATARRARPAREPSARLVARTQRLVPRAGHAARVRVATH